MKVLTILFVFAITIQMVSSDLAGATTMNNGGVLPNSDEAATINRLDLVQSKTPGIDYPWNPMAATITITPDNDPDHLINALLVPGTGITVKSVTFTGAPTAVGLYTDGPFGIANGIILASGDVTNALPPDESSGTTTAFELPGCPWCDDIIPGYVSYDAAILEIVFDVDDSAKSISFDFVFGSEEYPEYVGSPFNDVYGAYLNGVQISFDADGNPITINGPFFSGPYVHTPPDNGLEYDGSTTRLTTMASVTPGSTDNTLVFIVCDAGDYILDSGVMLAKLESDVTPSDSTITGVSPEFVPIGEFLCGDTVILAEGSPFSMEIEALDVGPNSDIVILSATGLPTGAFMTPALPLVGNPVASNFDWTPASDQAGMTFMVTFFVTDSIDGFSNQCEYTFVVEEGEEQGDVTPTYEWINIYCYEPEFNGVPLSGGDVIKAYDPDGVLCGMGEVLESGEYGFIPIYRDDEFTLAIDEGAEPGDLISFTINDEEVLTDPEVIWTSNGMSYELCTFYTCKTIELVAGWNLISWNLDYEATIDDFMTLMGPGAGCVDVILGFDRGALTYDPELVEYSTLDDVDFYNGYWIKMDCDYALEICGKKIPADWCIPLYNGWNLVSYWPDTTLPTEDALTSIMSNTEAVFAFDGDYKIYIPSDIVSSTLLEMTPYLGYWLKMSTDENLEYPGWSCISGINAARTSVPLAYNGVVPSRNSMSIYGTNLTIDGKTVAEGAVIEVFSGNGTAYGHGVYSDGLLKFTPIYGNDGSATDYPKEGDQLTIHIDGQPVYPQLTFIGEGERVAVARFSSEPGGNGVIPLSFSLEQNYPNPFNPTTNISFSIPSDQHVTLEIYNVIGQRIKTLLDGFITKGNYTIEWNSEDENGEQVSSGMYFYRLTAGDVVYSKKMTLLK